MGLRRALRSLLRPRGRPVPAAVPLGVGPPSLALPGGLAAGPAFASHPASNHAAFLTPCPRRVNRAISAVQRVHSLDVPLFGRVRLRGEPGIQYLPRDGLGRAAQAQAKDVRLVPRPRPAGRLCVRAEGGPDTGNLVCCDRYTRAGPTEEYTLVAAAFGDASGDHLGHLGPRTRIAV